MRTMFKTATIVLLILLLGACQSEGKYKKQLETDRFVYYSDDELRDAVLAYREDLEAGYDTISQQLKVQYKGKIEVKMYNKTDFVNKFGFPIGATGGYYRKGILLQPQATNEVAIHELTHFMINQINPNTPRWLNEGISSYMAGDQSGWEITTWFIVSTDRVPPYSSYSIEDPSEFFEMKGYELATSMIDYIVNTYNWSYVIDLIHSPHDFEGIFGMSGEEFWDSWKQYLREMSP